jgi:hypothetical protein
MAIMFKQADFGNRHCDEQNLSKNESFGRSNLLEINRTASATQNRYSPKASTSYGSGQVNTREYYFTKGTPLTYNSRVSEGLKQGYLSKGFFFLFIELYRQLMSSPSTK